MAILHDRAARLAGRKLSGRYRPGSSPDIKGKKGRAEVKTSSEEIPKALKQLSGGSGPAYIVLPKPQQKKALERLKNRKTGLMDYRGNVTKKSIRK